MSDIISIRGPPVVFCKWQLYGARTDQNTILTSFQDTRKVHIPLQTGSSVRQTTGHIQKRDVLTGFPRTGGLPPPVLRCAQKFKSKVKKAFTQETDNMRKILFRIMLCLAAVLFIPAVRQVHNLRAFTVISGSMEPAIRTGSMIITDTTKKEPEAGDVITYEAGNTCVTHRVIRIEEHGNYITKGDHNPSEDPAPVNRDQVTGTVILVIPFAGAAAMMLRRPSAICLLVLFIVFIWAKERFKHENEQKNNLYPGGRSGRCSGPDQRNNGLSDGL